MMGLPDVILVDENDAVLGQMGKMDAHRNGVLHRAFSVFIFNSKGEWLLQKRADSKYHSPGLWTNSCCSHPYPGEETLSAAHRRLAEEMNIRCKLEKAFEFIYKAEVGNGLTEHELDHVFFGTCDDTPDPDPSEVSSWRYVDAAALLEETKSLPGNFTTWFNIVLPKVIKKLETP